MVQAAAIISDEDEVEYTKQVVILLITNNLAEELAKNNMSSSFMTLSRSGPAFFLLPYIESTPDGLSVPPPTFYPFNFQLIGLGGEKEKIVWTITYPLSKDKAMATPVNQAELRKDLQR
jgi:hypothetical protein